MQRIKGDHVKSIENRTYFQDADPSIEPPRRGTKLTSEWCNAVQEEICGVIENSGVNLDENKNTQLNDAIESKFENISKKLTEYEKANKAIQNELDSIKRFNGELFPIGSVILTTQSLEDFQKSSIGKLGRWIIHPHFKDRYFRVANGEKHPHARTLGNAVNLDHISDFLDECEVNGQGSTIWEKPVASEKTCVAAWDSSEKATPHRITSFKKESSQTQFKGSIQSPSNNEKTETRPDTVYINAFYREA